MTIKEDVMLCMEERQQEEKRKKKAEDAASATEGRGVMVATAEAAMGVMVDGKGATAAVSAPREDMGGVSTAGVPLAATPVSDATVGGSRGEETLRTEVAQAAVATTAIGVTASLVTVPGAQQTTGMAVGRSGGAAATEGVRAVGRGATSTAAGRPSGQDLLTAGGRTAVQVVGPVAATSAGAGTTGVVTNSGGGDAVGGEDAESEATARPQVAAVVVRTDSRRGRQRQATARRDGDGTPSASGSQVADEVEADNGVSVSQRGRVRKRKRRE
jgi:hypothetical protein